MARYCGSTHCGSSHYGSTCQAEAKIEREKRKTKEKKETVNTLKDDKTGHDHIGYADYAMCLSSLIFGALETPCVIGIYAQWGTGKSFIMEKIKVALKALQLEQTLFDQWPNIAPWCYVGDLRELIENGEEQILLMFDWVQMGMPELPLEAFHKADVGTRTS